MSGKNAQNSIEKENNINNVDDVNDVNNSAEMKSGQQDYSDNEDDKEELIDRYNILLKEKPIFVPMGEKPYDFYLDELKKWEEDVKALEIEINKNKEVSVDENLIKESELSIVSDNDKEVDFEKELKKERKDALEHYFNDINNNLNMPVKVRTFQARYSVKSSKAKAMKKLYENQRKSLKLFLELVETEEDKAALEDLLKREGQIDSKAKKQLKNFKSRIEALQKGIAKVQKYIEKRTKEIVTEDEVREAPVSEQEEDSVKNIKRVSLQKENEVLHEKVRKYSNALAAMSKPRPNDGWFSNVKNWFVKKYYIKKERQYRTKLYQNELDLTMYLKDEELEAERLKNMVMPDWDEIKKSAKAETADNDNLDFNLGNEGDLDYHKFTGRGPSARHHSEIFDKRDKTIEIGSFKDKVLHKVYQYVDRKIDKLDSQLADHEEKVFGKILGDNLKEQKSGSIESVKNDLLLAVQYDEEYKKTNEQIFKISGDKKSAEKRLKNIKDKLKNVEKRLAKRLKARANIKKKYNNPDMSPAIYFYKYQKNLALFEKLDENVNVFKNGIRNASFTKKDYDEWYKHREEAKKYYELAVKTSKSIKDLEKQIRDYDKDIASFRNEIEELKAEEKTLLQGNPSEDQMLEFLKIKQQALAQAVEINKKSIVGYDKLLKYDETRKQLLKEKADFQKQRENAEKDVLAAEETTVLLNDKTHTEVKGMYVNNMVYFDEEQLKQDGINLYDKDKNLIFNGQDLLKKMEIQKIVKALKSRPIFTFLNSDTIMEYMSYDEFSGEFLLAKEGITAEQKRAYDQKFRSAYFKDDSTIINKKIQKDPSALKAFGNVMWDIGKAAFNEGWPEGFGAFGIDAAIAMGTEQYGVLENFVPENFKGRGVEDEIKYKKLRNGIREATDTLLTIADKPSIGNIFHTNCCVAIKDANSNFFLKNTGFDLNALGLAAYVLDIIQFGSRIINAQKDVNKQKAEMEGMLMRHHKRFATIMKAAKTESEVERMKGAVSAAFSLARDAVLMTTGITGFTTDLVSMTCKIVTKAIFSGIMRGKSNEEILNSPEILGGIDYNKNVLSEDEFNQVLSSVTGFKSKKDLAKAMHVINGVDLHRAALKSLKEDKPNAEVDRSMHALGFGDRRRYNKVKVRDILYKTMGATGKWRDVLRETVEYSGVDYDTSWTRFRKEKKGIYHYKDEGHKTRRINDYEMRKKLLNEIEGKNTFESQTAKFNRVKRMACLVVAIEMYDVFREIEMTHYKNILQEKKSMPPLYEYVMNEKNRESMIEMLSQTEVADNRALNLSKPITKNELFELAKEAIVSIKDKLMLCVNKSDKIKGVNEEVKKQEPVQLIL